MLKQGNLMELLNTVLGSILEWPCIIRAVVQVYLHYLPMLCELSTSKDVRHHIEGKKHCDNVRGLERQQRGQLPALSSLSKTSKCREVPDCSLFCCISIRFC